MSIIIKDVKMPSGCFDCPFRDKTWDECKCPPNKGYPILSCLEHGKRASWCPLVELPEKHGRLLDENDVIDAIYTRLRELQTHKAFIGKHGDIDLLGVLSYIANIKAVVEAEGE